MQRVAIFKFNWGRRAALLLIFALSVLIGTLFAYNFHANAATDATYKTETSDNIKKKIKALKYYASLTFCTQSSSQFKYNWKTTISGTDIDKGPRWWVNATNSFSGIIYIGQFIDSWGDNNGITNCNGENDSSPGWITDMFPVFGLTLGSDKIVALRALGYNCDKDGSGYSCTNPDINSKTAKKGILYQARNASYLNGVDPLTVQPDLNAMSYYLAINALTSTNMCKAQPSGSSNLVTVSQVQPNGTIVSGDWSVQNDGGPGRVVVSGFPIVDTLSDATCQDQANATVKYATDYQKWSAIPSCTSAFPAQATDPSFMAGCIVGRLNPTNYALCLTYDFLGSRSINVVAQDACFLGQGLPVDQGGVSSGRLCATKLGYTESSLLTACINGSINRTTAYCDSTYPVPDQIPNRPVQRDSNAKTRAACLDGNLLIVTGGGIPTDPALNTSNGAAKGDTTSCGIEGIGWLICPIITFMGSLLSDAFKGLADNFLSIDTGLFNTNSGTYLAWSVFRNFANIAFVIAFLIIIFSQLTGVGVTNYGVKKLLPRIVIAAILVNISYFVCQLAVDLSNILGYSLKQVFDGIALKANVPTSSDASGNGWGIAAIIGGVIATAAVAYFSLAILIPILIGALFGVLMVVLMLIARKAIIILLIVLSPLAFVAFLLPNTESLFTKWRKAFMALLLLFPIISVVFGVSSLASQIVLKAGPGTGSQQILQIMAVGIATLPFFIVPTLLKGSLNSLGSVGGKLTGFASKIGGSAGKGFGNTRLGKGAEYLAQERKTRNALMQSGQYKGKWGKINPRNLRTSINRGLNKRSGTFGTRLSAGGVSLAAEQIQKDTKAAGILLGTTPARQDVRKALGSKDPAMRRAAIERIVSTNDINGINGMVGQSHNWSAEERTHLADTLGSAGNRPAYLGQATLADIREGVSTKNPNGLNIQNLVKSAVDNNAYSAAKLATTDGDELAFVANEVAKIGGPTQDKIELAATDALTDARIAPTIGKGLQQVTNLAQRKAPAPEVMSRLD